MRFPKSLQHVQGILYWSSGNRGQKDAKLKALLVACLGARDVSERTCRAVDASTLSIKRAYGVLPLCEEIAPVVRLETQQGVEHQIDQDVSLMLSNVRTGLIVLESFEECDVSIPESGAILWWM